MKPRPKPLFPWRSAPTDEVAAFVARMRSRPDVLDVAALREVYRNAGADLLADPAERRIVDLALEALDDATGFSIVRIGDGEANILALDWRDDTPFVDRSLFEASILNQTNRFTLSEPWFIALQEMMAASVASADVVGALGVWTPPPGPPPVDRFIAAFERDPRGIGGQWTGRALLAEMASDGAFAGRIVASAYLYAGVVADIDRLLAGADRIFCLTDQTEAVDALKQRAPAVAIDVIPVGSGLDDLTKRRDAPDFLAAVRNALPRDLAGALCLVGAGPWAEIYCHWIKRRGGVAIDLGSGFDLLAGKTTRPIHGAIATKIGEVRDRTA